MEMQIWKGPVLQTSINIYPYRGKIREKCYFQINATEIEVFLNKFKPQLAHEAGIFSDTINNTDENFFRFRLEYSCKYKETTVFKYQKNPEISELGLGTNFVIYDYGAPFRATISENLNIIDFRLYNGVGPFAFQSPQISQILLE
jgi:hypothetical protein